MRLDSTRKLGEGPTAKAGLWEQDSMLTFGPYQIMKWSTCV